MRLSFLSLLTPCFRTPALGSVLLLVTLAVASAQQPAPSPAAENPAFKSVFVDDVGVGKDPFFPKSVRRTPSAPPVEVKPVTIDGEGLELRGVSGVESNRLAIINNRTFAVGEEHVVKIQNQRVPVKCLEIRDNSVVVSIGGATRELFFRKKL